MQQVISLLFHVMI